MKHIRSVVLLFVVAALIGGLAINPAASSDQARSSYEDGTYRGVFIDSGGAEVVVQFTLKENVVTDARFRVLQYSGKDYRKPEAPPDMALAGQYHEVLAYLKGKDIREHISDLYAPGNFVKDVDGFSGATIRANKVRSALQDGLNRGVYSY